MDELGYLPFEPDAAHLFFQLVSRRYERGAMLITSNRAVGEWGTVFGDPVVATAILDRMLHHSHIVTIRGESYRLHEKRRSGLLQKAAPTLFVQAVALAADSDDVAVVEHSVEDGGGDHRVAEDRAPLPDGPVRGDQHGSAFVTAADQLEEQMSGVGFERQIAEFVHDQQLRLGEVGELPPRAAPRRGPWPGR